MSSTLRNFLILIGIAALITAFQLQAGLGAILLFLRILFLVLVGFIILQLWRGHREEISMWSRRARVVFYAAAALAVANVGAAFSSIWPVGGLETLIFFLVLAAALFAMWRVWRDERTYGY